MPKLHRDGKKPNGAQLGNKDSKEGINLHEGRMYKERERFLKTTILRKKPKGLRLMFYGEVLTLEFEHGFCKKKLTGGKKSLNNTTGCFIDTIMVISGLKQGIKDYLQYSLHPCERHSQHNSKLLILKMNSLFTGVEKGELHPSLPSINYVPKDQEA